MFGASLVTQMVNNLPAIKRPGGSIPGLGRCPEEGNGYLLQYACPEKSMDRGYNPRGHKESDMTERLTLYSVYDLPSSAL